MRITTLLVLPLFMLLAGCGASKKVSSPDNWKGAYLQFGSGGGFTGVTTTYTLLQNGQLFSRTGVVDGPLKELSPLDKKKSKLLFDQAAALAWPATDQSDPGNMSTTLLYHSQAKSVRLVWGGGTYKPGDDVTNFYKELQSLVSTKNQ